MPDNKQLIERLADFIGWFEEEIGGLEAEHPVRQAADTIERLEAELQALPGAIPSGESTPSNPSAGAARRNPERGVDTE